ncbi:hypothetical protein ACQKM1_22175 [Peribacillus frigoritolerans]|uniref:hypothetical protein n=1 Tax=Peribacillus frigoritolerans TaxID=450367 RepID=UPI003D02E4A0
MFYTQKIQSVGTISEFVSGSYKEKKKMPSLSGSKLEKMVWVPVAGITAGAAIKIKTAVAAATVAAGSGAAVVANGMPIGGVEAIPVGTVSGAITNQVIHAFDPLVNLMVSLSLPIASVILTGAALMVMINQKEKGYSLMMQASVGYVLVQMIPLFIKLLAGIGAAI